MTNNPKYIIVHHCGGSDANPFLDTSNQSFEVVNEYHRQLWNFKSSLGYYIGYQYYIDKSGKVTQGRSDTEEGAHTIGKNNESIGICVAGNFDLTFPTPKQTEALKSLIGDKMKQYGISINNVVPHRAFAVKTCYGRHLSDDWARKLVETPIPVNSPVVSCGAERDIIKRQESVISNLKKLLQDIIKLIKK